jgi:hypothetical protein
MQLMNVSIFICSSQCPYGDWTLPLCVYTYTCMLACSSQMSLGRLDSAITRVCRYTYVYVYMQLIKILVAHIHTYIHTYMENEDKHLANRLIVHIDIYARTYMHT